MILSTHAISGAVLAELVPNHKILAFCVGFASHFVLDTIPHWDYKLSSLEMAENDFLTADMKFGRKFLVDAVKTGADALLGIIIGLAAAFYIFHNLNWAILFGAVGGLAPDFLQFVYMKIKREPLTSLQKFHGKIHAKKRLDGKHILGIFLQASVVAVLCVAVYFLKINV